MVGRFAKNTCAFFTVVNASLVGPPRSEVRCLGRAIALKSASCG